MARQVGYEGIIEKSKTSIDIYRPIRSSTEYSHWGQTTWELVASDVKIAMQAQRTGLEVFNDRDVAVIEYTCYIKEADVGYIDMTYKCIVKTGFSTGKTIQIVGEAVDLSDMQATYEFPAIYRKGVDSNGITE